MAQNIQNPFIVKGKIPKELFCDREKETAALMEKIRNGHNILLISPRRMGKTGLIDHCFTQSELTTSRFVFFVDILQTTSLQEFTYVLGRQIFDVLKPVGGRMLDLFLRTVRSLSAEFGYDALTGTPKFNVSIGTIQNPQYTLEEIFSYLEKAERRCLIAIDEFQQIERYPEKGVEALLRTHIQHTTNVDFIFAGSERHILTEMFNSPSRPFYQSTTMLSLDKIPIDKYTDFVQRLFTNAGKKVEADLVARVYNLFEGNTYCLQKTFNVAYSMTKESRTCDESLLRNAIKEILEENEHSYKLRLSLLTAGHKELLFAIADEGVAKGPTSGQFVRKHHLASASSVQSSLKHLIANDWITFIVNLSEKKEYRLVDYFLMLWIRDHFGNGWQF